MTLRAPHWHRDLQDRSEQAIINDSESLPFQCWTSSGTCGSAVQLGYSTRRVDNALDLLLQTLLVIATLAILVAAFIGYVLAGRALQPVADITRLASQVDGDDLDARLHLDLPNDELGRLASTFDSMLERIELAFRRQRQFTGDAAHELRTPLSLMRSQIDLALTQAETPVEYQEALGALDGDVSRMTTLVGMLLSLARADAGQLMPNREPVDLADLALDVADQLEPIALENGLTITTDLQPVMATVDADMIIQVLVNLIDNAITNTPSGGAINVKVVGGQRSVAVVVARPGYSQTENRRPFWPQTPATGHDHCVRHRDRHCA